MRLFFFTALAAFAQSDHAAWDALLKKYVTTESRVHYAQWKTDGVKELDAYLSQQRSGKASLINAYNAHMIRWILTNYPTSSVFRTSDPFREPRNQVNGRAMSLDDIETELRNMGDPRIHAALVCAARSCPPLRREAYTDDKIDAQLDDNTRQWLGNPKLNAFGETSSISPIFEWYAGDFSDLHAFLARYSSHKPGTKIEYRTYDWSLNDSDPNAPSYPQWLFYIDSFGYQPVWVRASAAALVLLGAYWLKRHLMTRTQSALDGG